MIISPAIVVVASAATAACRDIGVDCEPQRHSQFVIDWTQSYVDKNASIDGPHSYQPAYSATWSSMWFKYTKTLVNATRQEPGKAHDNAEPTIQMCRRSTILDKAFKNPSEHAQKQSWSWTKGTTKSKMSGWGIKAEVEPWGLAKLGFEHRLFNTEDESSSSTETTELVCPPQSITRLKISTAFVRLTGICRVQVLASAQLDPWFGRPELPADYEFKQLCLQIHNPNANQDLRAVPGMVDLWNRFCRGHGDEKTVYEPCEIDMAVENANGRQESLHEPLYEPCCQEKTTGRPSRDVTTRNHTRVLFKALVATDFGDVVKVVGNKRALGSWDPEKAPELRALEYAADRPQWKGFVSLGRGEEVEYKFVKVTKDGRVVWESGTNRKYRVPRSKRAVQEGTWR